MEIIICLKKGTSWNNGEIMWSVRSILSLVYRKLFKNQFGQRDLPKLRNVLGNQVEIQKLNKYWTNLEWNFGGGPVVVPSLSGGQELIQIWFN